MGGVALPGDLGFGDAVFGLSDLHSAFKESRKNHVRKLPWLHGVLLDFSRRA